MQNNVVFDFSVHNTGPEVQEQRFPRGIGSLGLRPGGAHRSFLRRSIRISDEDGPKREHESSGHDYCTIYGTFLVKTHELILDELCPS